MARRRSDAMLTQLGLSDWPLLNRNLLKFSNEELRRLLDLELAGERRWSYLNRIIRRLCRLETATRINSLRAKVKAA